ncbi:MAG: DUF1638 domain-containing protein, partial [Planctomycetes bacterium]|nr:DUF1638 domain-containing protein [Planctomycetota bacterium]
MKLKVVACGVFDRELRLLAGKSQNRIEVELLDAGLHARPHELRLRAQDAIDRASREGSYDAVVLVYGLCGRGISGLIARTIPVVVPRVHDCVSLFLGSRDEYRRQFAAHPGTMYMTSGWFEKKVHPKTPKPADHQKRENLEAHPKFREYAAKYGEDNAAYIIGFFDSWRRNYTRAAFIEHGLGDSPTYERYTRSMAEEFGWQFAKIPGSLRILDKLVNGQWDAEDVLVVKPGERVAMSTHEGLIESIPMDRGETPAAPSKVETRRVISGPSVVRPASGPPEALGLGVDAGGTYTDAVLYEFSTRKVLMKGKALTTPHDYTIGIVGAIDHLDKALFARVKLVSLSTTLATNSIVEGRGARVGLIFMPHMPEAAAELHVEPKRRVRGQIGIVGQELEPLDPDEVRAV